ncbi:MAG: hypothetical protein ACPHOG_09570 [Verrucomicrobiales bacterium]
MKEVQNSYNTSQNQTNNPKVGSRVQLYGGGCVTLITILVFGSTGAKIKYHGGGFIDHLLYYSSIIIGIFLIIGFLRLMKKIDEKLEERRRILRKKINDSSRSSNENSGSVGDK